MQYFTKTSFIYSLSVLFCLLLVACGGDEGENKTQSSPTAQSVASPTQAISDEAQMISIKGESGDEAFSIELNSEEALIKFGKGQKTLTGELKRADKTKYYNEKGDIIAEVKYKDESIKLKNTNGDLLWKIKIKDDKIKISNNEEGENAFEIKQNENGKYKVKLLEKTLGEAKFKDGKISISGFQKYEISAASNTPAYVVLAIKDIPEDLRLVIMAELLKK
ncbi:MAG: hypothetical protein NW226_10145 [Microscillaceae bacterium]|nr:hypothetical protein [Microscillaceae bacterium]